MIPILLAASSLFVGLPSQSEARSMPREFRAAWVATVANIDWPSTKTLTTDQQRMEMVRILDTAKELRLNAIILQVRPSADALYASKLEPWSEYLTGQQGKAPDPYYDPLEFAVEEAHRRGLEIHCWFNPYRASLSTHKGPFADNHISKTHPEVVKKYGSFLWMDPGEPVVQRQTLDVIKDVVKRYDIDGVHLDDYFYPYPEKGQDFPDEASYGRYRANGGTMAKDDWRRNNVNLLVHGIYREIKKAKPWVKFGISPFGIYRPGNPPSIKAGVDQYAELYADAKKWLSEGWCDYLSPQLYWPIAQTAQSFPVLLDWWSEQNTMGRHLWPGLYTGKVGRDEGKTWNKSEILDQITLTEKTPLSPGQVHFSMKVFLHDPQSLDEALTKGPYRERALVPPSPWLSDQKPRPPKVTVTKLDGMRISLAMKPGDHDAIRFYTVRLKLDHWLEPRVSSESYLQMTLDYPSRPEEIEVTAVDRYENQSDPVVVRIPR